MQGTPCKFQTCYDTTCGQLRLRPRTGESADRIQPPVASGGAAAVIRLELHCLPDVSFAKLNLKTLRFFVQGDGTFTNSLIELLCNNSPDCGARPLGSGPEKRGAAAGIPAPGGLPARRRTAPVPAPRFWGYRLLQEYFAFPEKFYFLDLSGFEKLAAADFGEKIEAPVFSFRFRAQRPRQMLELGVSRSTFRLGCTPIVNLFEQVAEPILLEQKRFEYRIVSDARREEAMDIFSIDDVVGISSGSSEARPYHAFFSYRHCGGGPGPNLLAQHPAHIGVAYQ